MSPSHAATLPAPGEATHTYPKPYPQMIALAGNPNSGKSAFFNLLTGSHQKIANYPGATVEKKVGTLRFSHDNKVQVIDLPGTYSLDAQSPDEMIVQEIVLGLRSDTQRPDVLVVVIDATHLERSLYLASQLMEIGTPTVLCLNMFDVATRKGFQFDLERAQERLGMPVIPTVATRGRGADEMLKTLNGVMERPKPRRPFSMSVEFETIRAEIVQDLCKAGIVAEGQSDFWAGRIMSGRWTNYRSAMPEALVAFAARWSQTLEKRCVDISTFHQEEIGERHTWAEKTCTEILKEGREERSLSDRLDRVMLSPILGPVVFLGIMTLVFQAVFSWAAPLMEWIDQGVGLLGTTAVAMLPASMFRDMLVDGVIGGVGAVVIFIPQIMILFFFIGLLEDSGYLSRAAFLVDRLMVRSGLSGKSFLPLLSSFACAVPGIMASRTIQDEKDRLTTIMVAPLMTCSARLPVDALLIGAFIPPIALWGMRVQGLVLLSLYLLGVLGAVVVAKVFRQTLLKGPRSMLVMELPDYRLPHMKNILRAILHRTRLFLERAGKIILLASLVLWFLAYFPRHQGMEAQLIEQGMSPAVAKQEVIRHSYAGRIGTAMEPLIKPLGFDWKVGVGLLSAFAAREVFVATIGTIYNVQEADEESVTLRDALQRDRHAGTGSQLFTLPMVLALLVFFVFAMQCLSTVAVIRRETNSWKWPLVALTYTYALAYLCGWLTYQGAHWVLAL